MADEIIRLDYSAEDIGDNIDEVREARGEYDSLDERLDEIEGGGFTPTQAQLDAMNSGITDDDVEQIDLNKNNILSCWSLTGGVELNANTDMNNITAIGNYYASASNASTIVNRPVNLQRAFNLKVYNDTGIARPTQVYDEYSQSDSYHRKWERTLTDSGWTNWVLICGDLSTILNINTIASNSNMNDFISAGYYRCESSAIASTLSNCPTTSSFMLRVQEISASTRYIQEIIPNERNKIFRRWYDTNGLSNWYLYEGTEVIIQ